MHKQYNLNNTSILPPKFKVTFIHLHSYTCKLIHTYISSIESLSLKFRQKCILYLIVNCSSTFKNVQISVSTSYVWLRHSLIGAGELMTDEAYVRLVGPATAVAEEGLRSCWFHFWYCLFFTILS